MTHQHILEFPNILQIDLARPAQNQKTSGFTIEERTGFDNIMDHGFVDCYRQLYPEETNCYTYFSYRFNCRSKNIGWRLDYFLVSEALKNDIKNVEIINDTKASDHLPILLNVTLSLDND